MDLSFYRLMKAIMNKNLIEVNREVFLMRKFVITKSIFTMFSIFFCMPRYLNLKNK